MNKTKVMIRIIAGVYLLYSSYSLGRAILNGETEGIGIPIFTIAFVIFGAAFVITGILDMKKISAYEKQEAQAVEERAAEEPEEVTEVQEIPRQNNGKKSIAERARMTADLGEEEEEK